MKITGVRAVDGKGCNLILNLNYNKFKFSFIHRCPACVLLYFTLLKSIGTTQQFTAKKSGPQEDNTMAASRLNGNI